MSPPTPPKIALCLEYPIGLRGGVSIVVRSLIAGLKDRYRLLVVSPDSDDVFSKTEPDVPHLRWNAPKPTAGEAAGLAELIANERVDLAHFHLGGTYGWGNRLPGRCPFPMLARKNIPIVTSAHLVVSLLHGYCGPDKPLLFKLAALPVAWLGKRSSLRAVRREIAVSEHDLRLLRRWHPGLNSKFERIYHSRLTGAARLTPPPSRQPVILYVGHIAFRKGQPVLARAFARIAATFPEWSLRFCGDIVEQGAADEIRATAESAGLQDRIEILPPSDAVTELMSDAGIYVQPSLEEALGLALQEAMFHGCACIGSNVGGIPELINDASVGVLVEPGNTGELAESIARLINNEADRQRLGTAAAESIRDRDMTEQAMVRRHIELYESVLHPE